MAFEEPAEMGVTFFRQISDYIVSLLVRFCIYLLGRKRDRDGNGSGELALPCL